MAMGAIAFVVGLAVYIYTAIAIMAIAKKTNTPNGWFAFIPILNIYLLTQMGGVSGLWTLVILADIFLGGLATGVFSIVMFWRVAGKIGFPNWTSLLLLVPIVNLVMLGLWAWKK